MQNRRFENRLLCAELVELQYRDTTGRERRRVVNLEDISLSGACIQSEVRIQDQSSVSISYGDGELVGRVCYCVFRDRSFFIGIGFSEGCRWSKSRFQPAHLMDPVELVHGVLDRRFHGLEVGR